MITHKLNTGEKIAIIGLVISLVVLLGSFIFRNPMPAQGSVQDNQGYTATTTDATWVGAKIVRPCSTICPIILGSVVITTSSATTVILYDATTTDINKRTGGTATSTITVAAFGVSTAAGTYTFDAQLKNGLIVDPSITVPGLASTTITFK